jgi:hypothetical protein
MFCVASAAPSTTPTTLGGAPSSCVRNIGSTGYSISVDTSAQKLVNPSKMTFLGKRGAAIARERAFNVRGLAR